MRGLVKSGQLQFINGGWSMHDEACTHYVSMIENTAFGHRFLKEEFDYVPTVGWQIDPFGHSAAQVLRAQARGTNGLPALDAHCVCLWHTLTRSCVAVWGDAGESAVGRGGLRCALLCQN